MKQEYKNYVFSNFKYSENDVILKNELNIIDSINIDFSSGNIKNTGGFKDYFLEKFAQNEENELFFNQNREIMQKIKNIISYEYFDEDSAKLSKRYFALAKNDILYELNFDRCEISQIDIDFNSNPIIIKENGVVYFYDKYGVYVFEKNNDPIFIEGVVIPVNYEIVDGYLFFSVNEESQEIFISEDLNLLNLSNDFENYEKIVLDEKFGKLLKIIALGDKICIFQEYKISTYDIYATNKKLESECSLAAKIIFSTIHKLNDYIVFLTTSGIKTFDGNNINSVFENIFATIDLKSLNMFAAVYNYEYYLCVNKVLNNKLQPMIYRLNFDKKTFVSYGIEKLPIRYFIITNYDEYSLNFVWQENEKFAIEFISDECSEYTKYAKFNSIYFSEIENKQIDKLVIFASGKFYLRIKTDIEKYEFLVENNKTLSNLSIKGNVFTFEVYSDEAFELDAIFVKLLIIGDDL